MKFSRTSDSSFSLEMHSASSPVQELHRLSIWISSLKEAPERFAPAPVLISPDLIQLQNCFTRFQLQTPEQTLSIASNKVTKWAENCFFPDILTVSRPQFCSILIVTDLNLTKFKRLTPRHFWNETFVLGGKKVGKWIVANLYPFS